MGILMIITLVGISVAGLAAILAIWMERDPRRPAKFAAALSVLILMATGVMILQSIIDERDQADKEKAATSKQNKLEGDIARMMQTLDRLASNSDDPQLQAFMATELEAQARTNPEVVQKLAQRFSDSGDDPAEKLGKHLSSSEVEKIGRKGHLKVKKKAKKKKDKKKDTKKDKKEDKDKKDKKDTKKDRDARDGDAKVAPAAPRGIAIPATDDSPTVTAPMGVGTPRGIAISVDDGKKDEKEKKKAKKKAKKEKKKAKKKAKDAKKKAKKKAEKAKKKTGGLSFPG